MVTRCERTPHPTRKNNIMSDGNQSKADHDLDPAELFQRRNSAPPSPAPVTLEDASQPRVKVVIGPTILRGDGTFDETGGAQSFNAFQMISDGSDGRIITTGKSKTGSPRAPSELRPEDLVKVGDTDIEVRLAERMGFLKRLPDGTYQETGRAPTEEKQEEKPPEDTGEALADAQLESDLTAFVSGTDAGTQVKALMQLAENGEVNRSTLETAAAQLKMEPREVSAKLDIIADGFRDQAATFAKSHGIDDVQSFWDWAREARGREFQGAMIRHGMERSTSVYQPIIQAYLESYAERHPERALAITSKSGVTARKDPRTGEVLLNVPGRGEMPFQVAVRQRLIKLSGI
jgi:hypothetical protein